MRIESILGEFYCPPLTPETLRAAFDAVSKGHNRSGLTYATSSGQFMTVNSSDNGSVELLVWGFDAGDPDADGLGKYERRSNFKTNEFDKALKWASSQMEILLRETKATKKQKKPVALNKLRYNEPLERSKRAKDVGLKFSKERRGTDKTSGKYRAFKFTAGTEEKRYDLEVRIFWEGGAKGTSPAWVMCNCPDHRYSWEWALTQRHSSSLRSAKNKRPNVRNPKLLKATCKHVHAALEWLRWEKGL